MAVKEIAYLGPVGTYSHLVAEKCFGTKQKMIPLPTILDVCEFVSKKPSRYGIVPIENSSGGAIYETVDILLAGKPKVYIEKELSLDVNLALLGRKEDKPKIVYSHFAPLEHCNKWLRKNLRNVPHRVSTSTAAAAERASKETGACALGSRKLASIYRLDILKYPVEGDVQNITLFLCISGKKRKTVKPTKTTLAAKLPNKPGSLCTFLEVFRNEKVNLSRLISRPIRGSSLKQYAFLLDIEGGTNKKNVKTALTKAGKVSATLKVVGSYPVHKRYKS